MDFLKSLWDKYKSQVICLAAGLAIGGGAVWFYDKPEDLDGVVLPNIVTIKTGTATTIKGQARGPITWFVPPYEGVAAQGTAKDLSFFAGNSGVYWVGATSLSGGKPVAPTYTKVVAEGVLPPPVPPGPGPEPPTPVPPIPPPPSGGKLWVIVVHDASKDTPEFAALINDKSMLDSLKKDGHIWQKYSDKKPDLKSGGWKAMLDEAKTLPALILMDQTTHKGKGLPCPATEQALLEAVKKGI